MSNVKDTNPKDAIGIRKFAFSVLPLRVMAGVTLAFVEGALKYGRHNYRIAGVRASVYFDATIRHLFRYWEGEDLDPEAPAGARLHHIDKAIASLVVLRDAMLNGMLTDDRPPRIKEWATDLNERTAALLDAFPNPVAPYTIDDSPEPFEISDAMDTLRAADQGREAAEAIDVLLDLQIRAARGDKNAEARIPAARDVLLGMTAGVYPSDAERIDRIAGETVAEELGTEEPEVNPELVARRPEDQCGGNE